LSNIRVFKTKGSKELVCVDDILFAEVLLLLFSRYVVAQCEKQNSVDVEGVNEFSTGHTSWMFSF
jgi:hypothetical protein